MFGSRTLANCRERTIGFQTTGNSNRFTIVLGVTMSVEKLPPMTEFTGTRDGRIAMQFSIIGQQFTTFYCQY